MKRKLICHSYPNSTPTTFNPPFDRNSRSETSNTRHFQFRLLTFSFVKSGSCLVEVLHIITLLCPFQNNELCYQPFLFFCRICHQNISSLLPAIVCTSYSCSALRIAIPVHHIVNFLKIRKYMSSFCIPSGE